MAHLQLGQPQESEHVWAHWLLTQVQCHTAREGHPWRIFSWGNRKSLVDMPKENNVETRPLLVDYYNAHYKAEQMALVVLGGEDLDTLQKWVGEIFSTVKSGKKERVNAKAAGAPFGGKDILLLSDSTTHTIQH
jgi:secreted Zn-dependent insulinase-like peptidase